MAITLEPDIQHSLEIEEYLDLVTKEVDPLDQASIVASAVHLKALSNNRSFLVDLLNDQLKNLKESQEGNSHTGQTIMVGARDGFFIRANVWMPARLDGQHKSFEDKVLSYLQPHDHNFDLLTVGYLGAGYETEIHEYDRTKVEGYVGERVDIQFLERTSLPKGRVLFYRANQDIHTQIHPTELSISVNMLVPSLVPSIKEQFYFDVDKGEITSYVDGRVSARSILFRLAAELGNDETCDCLGYVARQHPTERSRAQAYQALARLQPAGKEAIWRRALKEDKGAVVRRQAHKHLEELAT